LGFSVTLAFSFATRVGAVADDFNGLVGACCDATTFGRDGFATALGGFVALAFAVLVAAFLRFEGLDDFLCDFLDIRLPFVAFRRTMIGVMWAGAAESTRAVHKVLS
jgi:hypothetical protein